MRRLRTMRSLSSLRERYCARRGARIRATRWHRRENHEATLPISGPRPSRRLLAQAPQSLTQKATSIFRPRLTT